MPILRGRLGTKRPPWEQRDRQCELPREGEMRRTHLFSILAIFVSALIVAPSACGQQSGATPPAPTNAPPQPGPRTPAPPPTTTAASSPSPPLLPPPPAHLLRPLRPPQHPQRLRLPRLRHRLRRSSFTARANSKKRPAPTPN